MMKNSCRGHKLAYILVIIGALNWGLVGVFQYNLVNQLLGSWSWLERLVYVLVGAAGVMMCFQGKCCYTEEMKSDMKSPMA